MRDLDGYSKDHGSQRARFEFREPGSGSQETQKKGPQLKARYVQP